MAPPAAPTHVAGLLVLLAGVRVAIGACTNVTLISTQLDAMLATYDRGWQPSSPVLVEVQLNVRHATINDASATVRLLAEFRMSWKDDRLSWNTSEWKCSASLVAAERLWLPDVGVLTAASAASSTGESGMRALLSSDGSIIWIQHLDLSAPVTLDLTSWPQDDHLVTFKFGSRSHFVDEIELSLKEFKQETVFESGAWEMVDLDGSEEAWRRGGSEARVVTWAVRLRRRAAAHALAARVVLVATALLLVAAALTPPASRSPLCAAASFTAAFWAVAVAARTGGSSSAPRALVLVGTLCACGGAAAAAAALAVRVARCTLPPPRQLRPLLSGVALLRRLTPLEVRSTGEEESSAWAAAAQVLDALCLLALLLTLLLVIAFSV